MTKEQKFVQVNVGSNIEEGKVFLGYEFSDRKVKGGIQENRDEERRFISGLYGEKEDANPDKANYYIRKSFLGKFPNVSDKVKQHISYRCLADCLDFEEEKKEFSKSINLKKSPFSK